MKRLATLTSAAFLLCACGDDTSPSPSDAGPPDAGETDAGPLDAGPPDAGPAHVTAMTEDGPVVGLDRGTSLMFRGIPFAAPPVGPLRFAAPAAVTPWTVPLDATGPGT